MRSIAQTSRKSLGMRIVQNWGLYVLLLPSLVYLIIFAYVPMYGILIAFKEYKAGLGILRSPFAAQHGLKYFSMFLNAYNFEELVVNTLRLSVYSMLAGAPFPIIFALMLNYLPRQRFKKIVQTVTYAPHFISVVVLCGMLYLLLAPTSGIVNKMIIALGGKSVFFLNSAQWFPHVYVWSGVWQHMGWDAILYIAALTNISPELHAAAIVDGANKLQRIAHIDLPGILPTVVIVLILNTGSLMNVGFEKVYLLQNNMNIATSETMATYIYKLGLINNQFSLSTAVGLFNSVINFAILVLVNFISRRLTQSSLW